MRFKKLTSIVVILSCITASISPIQCSAYVLNDHRVNNPKNIKVSVTDSASGFPSMSAYFTWATYSGSPFGFSGGGLSSDIIMEVQNVESNAYAIAYYLGGNKNKIVYYKQFINATNIVQQETVVHEVGHALGLNHCQSAWDSISVMREIGFNYKAYPLADDKDGIRAMY